jgi:hypothetical protein
VREFFQFYWSCFRSAFKGSIELANAWAPILGAIIIWGVLRFGGYRMMLPETFGQGIILSMLCLIAAWISLLMVRFIFAGPRLWGLEKNARKAAENELAELKSEKSDIDLILHKDMAYESGLVDVNGNQLPPAKVFIVRITNGGDKFLQKCQITFGQKGRFNYPVSGCFDLRRGEYKDLAVLRVNYRGEDSRAFVYFLQSIDWKISVDGPSWLPGPGIYEIRALSADTHPAALDVELSRTGSEWGLAAHG